MSPSRMYREHRHHGRSLDALAADTGLTRYQVSRVIREYREAVGEVIISDRCLREYRKAGMTIRQMAEKHACSTRTIWKKLRKMSNGVV